MTDSDYPQTFIFAHEIEQALVSLCFYNPDRIATVYRELDPLIHFTRPELRLILAAINLAWRELGARDFASIIQVLREEGKLDECGGREGVNTVFEQYRYGFSSLRAEEESLRAEDEIFAHYLEMLKTYAVNRNLDPPRRVYRFTGGRGTAWRNKAKRRPADPDFIGEAIVYGRTYALGLEVSPDGDAINFRLDPKR